MAKTRTGAQERRQREREQHRQEMIEAAVDLFAAKGYFGTRIEEVAERAAFSRSAIYLHFPGGKEELYAAVLTTAVQARTESVREALEHADPDDVDVAVVWGALTRFYDLHPNYMKLIGSLSYEDIRNAVPRGALEEVTNEGTKTFQLIDRALRRPTGAGKPLPKLHLAWTVWSALLGTVQFGESLAHVGHAEDIHGLLESTLHVLRHDFD